MRVATALLLAPALAACGRFDDTLKIRDGYETILAASIAGERVTLTSYTRDELENGASSLIREGDSLDLLLYHEPRAELFLENPIEPVRSERDVGRPIPDG